jgi:hypothetical protein
MAWVPIQVFITKHLDTKYWMNRIADLKYSPEVIFLTTKDMMVRIPMADVPENANCLYTQNGVPVYARRIAE